MSIFSYIEHDQKEISGLLYRIESEGADESDPRTDLFNELKVKLTCHNKAKKDTFYKALKKERKTADIAADNADTIENIQDLMHDLIQPDLTGPAWFLKFLELKKTIQWQFKHEQKELIAKAKELLSEYDAQELEQAMKNHKRHERETRDIRLREDIHIEHPIDVKRSDEIIDNR